MPKQVILQELQRGTVTLCPVGKWLQAGRESQANDVVCKDKHVSRRHCRIQAQPDGRLRFQDRSSYGTWINGERVGGECYAAPGDRIALGRTWNLAIVGMLDPDASHSGDPEPTPPRRMGANLILLRELGRGAMGIVYEAYDETRKKRCAVKWMREGGRATPELMERFRREAMLQGALSDYPGIVKIFDLGTVYGSGEMYCVMEYVDGESLLHMIQNGLETREGVRLLARVSRAVAYAHDQGVVHRDIKPGNIMVTTEGQVRLTDFGIAKALEAEDSGATLTGIMLGTPGYMAPEQIGDAKRAGPPADVYGLGAVLYTILTQKLPFQGKNLRAGLENVQRGKTVRRPRDYDPSIDPVLEAAALRALSHEAAERWPSAAEFAEELERWLRETDRSPQVRLKGP